MSAENLFYPWDEDKLGELLRLHMVDLLWHHRGRLSVKCAIEMENTRRRVHPLPTIIVSPAFLQFKAEQFRRYGYRVAPDYFDEAVRQAGQNHLGVVKPPAGWFDE